MLAIKLKRTGKKNQAHFRLIVIEKRSKIQGICADDLGSVNSRAKEYKIDKDRAKQWLAVGAKPTPTVYNLLVKLGITSGLKIPVHSKKKTKSENAA